MDREDAEAELEDQMLEGEINPKEWKAQVTTLKEESFEWELSEDQKDELIADFDGYPTEEAFIEAYEADSVAPFSDYSDIIEALRAEAPKREVPTVEEDAEATA